MNEAYATTAVRKSELFPRPKRALRGQPIQATGTPPAKSKKSKVSTAALGTPPQEAIALHKMSFGPAPGDIERIQQIGIAAYIEEQLYPENINDAGCDSRIAQENFTLLDAEMPILWARQGMEDFSEVMRAYMEVLQATWIRNIYSKRQLFELLTDHWHNHFNVYGPQDAALLVWPDHDRRIRANVFGNFREFLESIATSTAMLYYLDNASNAAAGPNENYARELFELHSLGAESYTPGTSPPEAGVIYPGYRDWDVLESARAFTGWTVDAYDEEWQLASGNFLYRPEWHDRFGKYILNAWIYPDQAPMKDARDVLDRIAIHPSTAKLVVTRLARRLVSDTPSESLISAGVTAFQTYINAPDQLRHVTRAILTHPEFTTVWAEKIRRPREIAVYALRSTQASWSWTDTFWYYSYLMGQSPFEWPAPNGYPDRKGAWSNSSGFVYRWQFINFLCEGYLDGSSVDVVAQTPGGMNTARQLVNFWASRILAYLPTATELDPVYQFLAGGPNYDAPLPPATWQSRLRGVVALILSSPFAQVR